MYNAMIQFWSDHSYNVMSVDLYWFLYTIFSMITNQMKNEIVTNFTIQYRYFSSSLIYNAHLIRKSINNTIEWCSKMFPKMENCFINQGICILNQTWPNKYVCNCTYVPLWEMCKTHNMLCPGPTTWPSPLGPTY